MSSSLTVRGGATLDALAEKLHDALKLCEQANDDYKSALKNKETKTTLKKMEAHGSRCEKKLVAATKAYRLAGGDIKDIENDLRPGSPESREREASKSEKSEKSDGGEHSDGDEHSESGSESGSDSDGNDGSDQEDTSENKE